MIRLRKLPCSKGPFATSSRYVAPDCGHHYVPSALSGLVIVHDGTSRTGRCVEVGPIAVAFIGDSDCPKIHVLLAKGDLEKNPAHHVSLLEIPFWTFWVHVVTIGALRR